MIPRACTAPSPGNYEEANGPYDVPADQPATLASYAARTVVEVFVEQVAVGAALPEMPLFLDPDRSINVTPEPTDQATYWLWPKVLQGIRHSRPKTTGWWVPRVVCNPCSSGLGHRARVADNPWHPAALRSHFLARLWARATMGTCPSSGAGRRIAARPLAPEGRVDPALGADEEGGAGLGSSSSSSDFLSSPV
jgi:hypothetical protein